MSLPRKSDCGSVQEDVFNPYGSGPVPIEPRYAEDNSCDAVSEDDEDDDDDPVPHDDFRI